MFFYQRPYPSVISIMKIVFTVFCFYILKISKPFITFYFISYNNLRCVYSGLLSQYNRPLIANIYAPHQMLSFFPASDTLTALKLVLHYDDNHSYSWFISM